MRHSIGWTRHLLGVAAWLVSTGLVLAAEPDVSKSKASPPGPDPSTPAASTCETSGNALVFVTCQLAHSLRAQTGSDPTLRLTVVSREVSGAPPKADVDGLKLRLADMVAGALGKGAQTLGALPLSSARRSATPSGLAIQLTAAFHPDGRFSVTADGYRGGGGFWARVSQARPSVLVHADADVRVDSELGRFLPKLPLVSKVGSQVPSPVGAATGLACADLDGNGSVEAVLVGRQQLALGRIVEGQFRMERQQAWTALSPVAGAPLREPVTTTSVDELTNRLRIGTTDRELGLLLNSKLEMDSRYEAQLPLGEDHCLVRQSLGLAWAKGPCAVKAASPQNPGLVDAAASYRVESSEQTVIATRRLGTDSVALQVGGKRLGSINGAGAQLAIGDIDRDGNLELVTSKNVLDSSEDGIRIYSLTNKELKLRHEQDLPGVTAIAICPAVDLGPSPLLVMSAGQLVVLR